MQLCLQLGLLVCVGEDQGALAQRDPCAGNGAFAPEERGGDWCFRCRGGGLRRLGTRLDGLGGRTPARVSPFNAFLLLQGLETLSLRVERHVENTLKVVEFLNNHPKVKKVNHPALPYHCDHHLYERYFPNGGGSIFTFEIDGGQDEAWRFIDSLEIFSLLANVADVKSLVIHPYTTTHSQLTEKELAEQNITPATIRLSIGTEHIDDIIDDLRQALNSI